MAICFRGVHSSPPTSIPALNPSPSSQNRFQKSRNGLNRRRNGDATVNRARYRFDNGQSTPATRVRVARFCARAADTGTAPVWQTAMREPIEGRCQLTLERRETMNRILRFNESGRADLLVHLTLGTAVVAGAVICLCATFDFASRLDRIGERLSARPAPTICATPNDEPRNSLTNVAGPELDPASSSASPQSDPPAGQPAAGRETDLPTGKIARSSRNRAEYARPRPHSRKSAQARIADRLTQ